MKVELIESYDDSIIVVVGDHQYILISNNEISAISTINGAYCTKYYGAAFLTALRESIGLGFDEFCSNLELKASFPEELSLKRLQIFPQDGYVICDFEKTAPNGFQFEIQIGIDYKELLQLIEAIKWFEVNWLGK